MSEHACLLGSMCIAVRKVVQIAVVSKEVRDLEGGARPHKR